MGFTFASSFSVIVKYIISATTINRVMARVLSI